MDKLKRGSHVKKEIIHSSVSNEPQRKLRTYLGNGKVQAHIDDDHQEEQVEGTNHQEGLLQQQKALECVVQLWTNRELC